MFQLWKLVLLCGLLTGTSASFLGDLDNDLKSVIDKGRDLVEDTVETVGKNLKEDLNRLQNSKLGQLSDQVLQKAEDLLAGAVSKVLPLVKDISGLKVTNVRLLDVKTELASDKKGLNLSFPISADVELDLPVIGKAAGVDVSLNLLSGVKIVNEDGKSRIVVTQCISDSANISLKLLGRRSPVANRLTDAVSKYLSDTLSDLVEWKVCPLVRLFINSQSVDIVQNSIDELVKDKQSSA